MRALRWQECASKAEGGQKSVDPADVIYVLVPNIKFNSQENYCSGRVEDEVLIPPFPLILSFFLSHPHLPKRLQKSSPKERASSMSLRLSSPMNILR